LTALSLAAEHARMLIAPHPADEALRLRALQQMQLLDTPPDERVEIITQLARRLFNVPIVLLSLVDHDRLWFKSRHGLEATESPRDTSICSHVILQDDVYVVEDALHDLRFADDPMVAGEPFVRFYAGVPLKTPAGHCIGALCVIDSVPREFSDDDRRLLRDLGRLAECQLNYIGHATIDDLTQIANRRGFCQLAGQALAASNRAGRKSVLLLINLNGFRMINDNYGHEAGDAALAHFAHYLSLACRQSDPVGHLGGDQFGVFLLDTEADGARALVKRLVGQVAQLNASGLVPMSLRFSVGLAIVDPALDQELDALLTQADAQLQENRRRQRQ